jgi:hypothetical protein
VTVDNAYGPPDTHNFQLTVNSTAPPEWTYVTADSSSITGDFCSLQVIGGNPAISYYRQSSGDLRYVRATNVNGTSWGSPVSVDTSGDTGKYTSLAVASGNPAIAYFDETSDNLRFVRASNATGSSWGSPTTVASAGNINTQGLAISLAAISGNPAISFYDHANKALKYVRASNSSGSSWGAPITLDDAVYEHTGLDNQLLLVSDRPAVAYYDYDGGSWQTRYIRAANSTGSSWGSSQLIDDVGGRFVRMVIANGNPAIASWLDSGTSGVNYIRATDSTGSSWGSQQVVAGGASTGSEGVSMAIVGGVPAVSYVNGSNKLYYCEAGNSSGTTWNSPLEITDNYIAYSYPSLCEVNGYPAVAYQADQGSYVLKYAILME